MVLQRSSTRLGLQEKGLGAIGFEDLTDGAGRTRVAFYLSARELPSS